MPFSPGPARQASLRGLDLPVDLGCARPDQRDQVASDGDRIVWILKAAQEERMDAELVISEHRGRNLFRRSDQTRRIAGGAGGARYSHPQPFVMDIAARGEGEQAFAGMIARLRRGAGFAFDV